MNKLSAFAASLITAAVLAAPDNALAQQAPAVPPANDNEPARASSGSLFLQFNRLGGAFDASWKNRIFLEAEAAGSPRGYEIDAAVSTPLGKGFSVFAGGTLEHLRGKEGYKSATANAGVSFDLPLRRVKSSISAWLESGEDRYIVGIDTTLPLTDRLSASFFADSRGDYRGNLNYKIKKNISAEAGYHPILGTYGGLRFDF